MKSQTHEPRTRVGRIAILWRGDEAERRHATPDTSRLKAVFAALAAAGEKQCGE